MTTAEYLISLLPQEKETDNDCCCEQGFYEVNAEKIGYNNAVSEIRTILSKVKVDERVVAEIVKETTTNNIQHHIGIINGEPTELKYPLSVSTALTQTNILTVEEK